MFIWLHNILAVISAYFSKIRLYRFDFAALFMHKCNIYA